MSNLATKYRPKTFNEVVGQDYIKQILNNQLESNDLRQAYLFTGGAGTGKTTIARILGKEANGEIIEIDAASNNSVDDVRKIREECRFRSISKDYKIFIVDEVHMLSKGAFNALLKTLEEPPSHAVFILATTEPQKIPATILSRCQRFDFKRIQIDKIIKRLRDILILSADYKSEDISDDVLEYLARLSEGGMRDAISLMDMILDYSGGEKIENITDVQNILGYTTYDDCFELLNIIIDNSTTDLIRLINDIHMEGKDLKQYIKQLIGFCIDIGKIGATKEFDYVKIPKDYEDEIFIILDDLKEEGITLGYYIEAFNNIYYKIKWESEPKDFIIGELIVLCK